MVDHGTKPGKARRGRQGPTATQVDPKTCEHARCKPPNGFDPELASTMSVADVRKNFPRFHGRCPDCGEEHVGYASFEHYVAGDW